MFGIKHGPERGEAPTKIEGFNDLENFLGQRVSVNPVEGGPESPRVREGEPRIVGVLKKYGNGFWVDHEGGTQQITEGFFELQNPRLGE